MGGKTRSSKTKRSPQNSKNLSQHNVQNHNQKVSQTQSLKGFSNHYSKGSPKPFYTKTPRNSKNHFLNDNQNKYQKGFQTRFPNIPKSFSKECSTRDTNWF